LESLAVSTNVRHNNIIHPTRPKKLAFSRSVFGRVMMSVIQIKQATDWGG
jgi:hypothetical protein